MAFYFQSLQKDIINDIDVGLQPNPLPSPIVDAPVFGRDTQFSPHLAIVMADNGFDVEQVCLPWRYFTDRGFLVEFVFPRPLDPPRVAKPDPSYTTGWKGIIMGPSKDAMDIYSILCTLDEFIQPKYYTDDNFSFLDFDVVLITGGRNEPMRQMLTDPLLHSKLKPYLRLCKRIDRRKDDPNVAPSKILGTIAQGALPIYINNPETTLRSTTIPVWMERTNSWISPPPNNSSYSYAASLMPTDKYFAGPNYRTVFTMEDMHHYYISGRCNTDIIPLSTGLYDLYRQMLRDQKSGMRPQRKNLTSSNDVPQK
ncbi:ThiJ domain protein [Schizosaccharomyces osmophilus]|uniref:ThiJ domain protein n=1 Tax=Schizosaccharomyces osmophilus TaxID=2545709 RepID=A0AAE9WG67_9SCHI|nr:ThiJ domain protein [Schizosaccharomyces osmophilus]WBW74622.1 ThiJ domain protein [Schizosaccharomyces osmophilus]